MLKLTVKAGEYLQIGDDIRVVYTGGGDGNAKFLVDAPKSLNIVRSSALGKRGLLPEEDKEYYRENHLSAESKERITQLYLQEHPRHLLIIYRQLINKSQMSHGMDSGEGTKHGGNNYGNGSTAQHYGNERKSSARCYHQRTVKICREVIQRLQNQPCSR